MFLFFNFQRAPTQIFKRTHNSWQLIANGQRMKCSTSPPWTIMPVRRLCSSCLWKLGTLIFLPHRNSCERDIRQQPLAMLHFQLQHAARTEIRASMCCMSTSTICCSPNRPRNHGPSWVNPFCWDSLAAGSFALTTANFNGPKPRIGLSSQWRNDTPLKQI